MRILLDTCTFLWLAGDDPALSPGARRAFEDRANDVFLSVVSLWEIIVKHGLGRFPLPEPPDRYLPSLRERMGLRSLEVDEEAVLFLPKLPPYHKDPFDRMLVCQALRGGFTLLSPDRLIHRYPVPTKW